MATTRDRNTLQREGSRFTHPVAADAVILAGTIVCLSAGTAPVKTDFGATHCTAEDNGRATA